MKLNARPQLNGNPPEDFRKAGLELYEAANALQQVLMRATATVTHGRNYQHVEVGAAKARSDDIAMIEALKIAEACNAAQELAVLFGMATEREETP